MIRLILVRHGLREKARTREDDAKAPLQKGVEKDVRHIAGLLQELTGGAISVLTSKYEHAVQTAKILAEALCPGTKAQKVTFLTPKEVQAEAHWADDGAVNAIAELELEALHRQRPTTAIWVGHETRLSQLVLRYTGQRTRQLEPLEAICIAGENKATLISGKGSVEWRIPVRDWASGDIRTKVQSKMVVATFLAAANFTALLEILINKPKEFNLSLSLHDTQFGDAPIPSLKPPLAAALEEWSAAWTHGAPALQTAAGLITTIGPFLPAISLALFFAAAAAFVATVFLYDRLAMPEGFWTMKPFYFLSAPHETCEQFQLHGHPYYHMIDIWKFFFTPGVVLSSMAVALLLITFAHPIILAICGGSVIIVKVVYQWRRPTGDID